MKLKFFVLPILTISLCSCGLSTELNRKSFYFDTYTDTRLFEGTQDNLKDITNIFRKIDKLTDNYKARDVSNVFTINNTNENVKVDKDLYEILNLSFSSDLDDLHYFNPLIGSLSKKWKNSLENHEILPQSTIDEELLKIASSSLELLSSTTVKRSGDAEIDLGAVAKGFALDKVKSYLDKKNISKYLVDCGSSSILLGEKANGENFKIQIANANNKYLSLKNCVISTSSMSRQAVEIDGVKYSHIVNPTNGSVINKNDVAIVISQSGYLGDILSTDFVNESVEDIKTLEKKYNVQSLIFKDNKIIYKNKSIEVLDK